MGEIFAGKHLISVFLRAIGVGLSVGMSIRNAAVLRTCHSRT